MFALFGRAASQSEWDHLITGALGRVQCQWCGTARHECTAVVRWQRHQLVPDRHTESPSASGSRFASTSPAPLLYRHAHVRHLRYVSSNRVSQFSNSIITARLDVFAFSRLYSYRGYRREQHKRYRAVAVCTGCMARAGCANYVASFLVGTTAARKQNTSSPAAMKASSAHRWMHFCFDCLLCAV